MQEGAQETKAVVEGEGVEGEGEATEPQPKEVVYNTDIRKALKEELANIYKEAEHCRAMLRHDDETLHLFLSRPTTFL